MYLVRISAEHFAIASLFFSVVARLQAADRQAT
jgi:hypothetical protein